MDDYYALQFICDNVNTKFHISFLLGFNHLELLIVAEHRDLATLCH